MLEKFLSLKAQCWLLPLCPQIPTGSAAGGVFSATGMVWVATSNCDLTAKMRRYVLYSLSCSKDFNGKRATSIQKRNIVTLHFYNDLVSHLITLSPKVTCLHTTDVGF